VGRGACPSFDAAHLALDVAHLLFYARQSALYAHQPSPCSMWGGLQGHEALSSHTAQSPVSPRPCLSGKLPHCLHGLSRRTI